MSIPPEMAGFDRLPPNDIDAEKSVIGALLLAGDDVDVVDRTRDFLRPESFYQPDLGVYFDSILRLRKAEKRIDVVTVRAEMMRAGMFDECGGMEFMSQLLTAVPSSSAAPYYAEIVREKYILREVIRAANKAISKSYAPSRFDRAAEIARDFLNDLTAIAFTGTSDRIHKLSDVLLEVMDEATRKVKKRIKTGLYELDDLIGGIPIGKFTLIGGRPRIGKSQLCKQIVLNVARTGVSCGIVTIEEDRIKIGQNYFANASGIENNRIVYGTASEVEWSQIVDAMPELSTLPIFIADEPVKLGDVESTIRALVNKHKCELVVVDYLQLVDPQEESNENRELTLVSRTLKQLFKRLGIAGIAACQLNRGNETNGVRKPTMRDLRGSGSLEQDGDLILLLHREDVYHQGEPNYRKTDQMEVIIAKNKDGPSGDTPLRFCGKTQTISDWAVDPFPRMTQPPVRVPYAEDLELS